MYLVDFILYSCVNTCGMIHLYMQFVLRSLFQISLRNISMISWINNAKQIWTRTDVSHNGKAVLSQGRKYVKFLAGSWVVSPPHVCGDGIIHSEMRCGVLLFWSHDTANLLILKQCTKTIPSVRLQSHLHSPGRLLLWNEIYKAPLCLKQ